MYQCEFTLGSDVVQTIVDGEKAYQEIVNNNGKIDQRILTLAESKVAPMHATLDTTGRYLAHLLRKSLVCDDAVGEWQVQILVKKPKDYEIPKPVE